MYEPNPELEKLKAEKAKVEAQLAQAQHNLQRLENRKKYYEKGERTKRTHRLVTRGAAIESITPLIQALTETEFYSFAEKVLALPEVKGLLIQSVNDHNRADFEKEVEANGTISLSCGSD